MGIIRLFQWVENDGGKWGLSRLYETLKRRTRYCFFGGEAKHLLHVNVCERLNSIGGCWSVGEEGRARKSREGERK